MRTGRAQPRSAAALSCSSFLTAQQARALVDDHGLLLFCWTSVLLVQKDVHT